MVRCAQTQCGKGIEEDWAFCPYCGGDNRPPKSRPGVHGCNHEFADGVYCLHCGTARFHCANSNPPDSIEEILDDGERLRYLSLASGGCLIASLLAKGPWRLLFLICNPDYYTLPKLDPSGKENPLDSILKQANDAVLFNIWATAWASTAFFLASVICAVFLWRSNQKSAQIQAVAIWISAFGILAVSLAFAKAK